MARINLTERRIQAMQPDTAGKRRVRCATPWCRAWFCVALPGVRPSCCTAVSRFAPSDPARAGRMTRPSPTLIVTSPAGLPPLLSAELVARDMAGFVNRGFVTPRLIEEVRLPSFAASANDRYLWPPQR